MPNTEFRAWGARQAPSAYNPNFSLTLHVASPTHGRPAAAAAVGVSGLAVPRLASPCDARIQRRPVWLLLIVHLLAMAAALPGGGSGALPPLPLAALASIEPAEAIETTAIVASRRGELAVLERSKARTPALSQGHLGGRPGHDHPVLAGVGLDRLLGVRREGGRSTTAALAEPLPPVVWPFAPRCPTGPPHHRA